MPATKITSRDNSLLRLARATRDGKNMELIFVEGLKLCEEALHSGLKLEAVIYSEEIAHKSRAAAFLKKVGASVRLVSVSEKLLGTIAYTKTPQGIVALAHRPPSTVDRLAQIPQTSAPLLVVMHGLSNPVNVGAILRSAEGAGVTGVIATSHTSDPFSPKSLRGAMGSAFRLPIWFGPQYSEVLDWCAKRKIATVSADLNAKKNYTDLDWRSPRALVIGTEAHGLSQGEVAATNTSVRIPMKGEVESLNAAVAAAIVLYEAARQRG